MEREAKQVRVFDDSKGEEFVVDDLFDFSNGEFEDGFLEKNMEDDEREAKPYSVSIGNGEKTEEGNFGSVLTTNLCFPVDDVADEWLSHFVEDSFSGYSVPFPPKPTEKMKTKVIEKPFLKNPDQTKVKMHGKKSSIDSYGYGCGVHETHRCTHCGVQKTPQWRAGPMGPKSLCNACGVRYKSGRLLPEYRPACSPTFSSEVHSNSHRKVLEMRRKKEGF